MARYDYICELCTEIFETEHPMTGPPPSRPVKCPVCGTGHVHKIIISTPAIKIWWRNARASEDAGSMAPKFLESVTRKGEDKQEAAEAGGN